MTLIVEDGTGDVDAESYVSAQDFEAYCAKRGYDLTPYDTAAQEEALRAATEYADTYKRFKAQRLTADQALQFPRDGLVDWSSFVVTGVPARLKSAVCYLAWVNVQGETLYADLDRGGAIASESVGPISVSYRPDAPNFKVYRTVDQLLCEYVRGDLPQGLVVDLSADTGAKQFGIGMMDLPGSSDTEGDLGGCS